MAPVSGVGSPEQRVRTELRRIRDSVSGVHGSLVATNDGFLVAHDVPDLEPTAIAALAATTRSLASRTVLSAGRGQFREAVARGSQGYLAVYAAGGSALIAVIGTPDLNIAMLHYQTREIVERIAAVATEFGAWSEMAATAIPTAPPAQPGVLAQPGVVAQPGVLAQPGVVAQPGVPAQPSAPAGRSAPAERSGLAQPGSPEQPGGLAQAGAPAQPGVPAGRSAPAQLKRSAPGQPSAPAQPSVLDQSSSQVQPGAAAGRAAPLPRRRPAGPARTPRFG